MYITLRKLGDFIYKKSLDKTLILKSFNKNGWGLK